MVFVVSRLLYTLTSGSTKTTNTMKYFDDNVSTKLLETHKVWIPKIFEVAFTPLRDFVLDKASKDVIGPRQLVRQKEWLEPAYKQVEAAFILKLEAEWDAAVGIAMTEKDIAETHGVRKFFPFSIPQIKNS